MKLSADGQLFLIDYEKVCLKAYEDSAEKWTIGVGHLLTKEELATGVLWINGLEVRWQGKGLSGRQASDLFAQDLAPRELALNNLLSGVMRVEQHEWDAMFCLMFNIGVGRFTSSSVLRLFKAGDITGAADAFLLFDKETVGGIKRVNDGLVIRREQERAMFLSGVYDSTH